MATPRRVHVVFKTHLDVGFTDLAAEVTRRYREQFIPQALAVARELRERGGAERFVWTTGSWLIDHALEHGDAAGRKALEVGIAAGDIRWHALPFTTHTELLDADMIRHGLSIAARLDRRFGVTTIAAKMTDVPGHTRGLVPLLAEAGVRFLHIGVNPASRPPSVPDCFGWVVGDAEVLVGYDKAYGGTLVTPGDAAALVFAHTGDNQGPQGADQIVAEFARIAAANRGAEVRAGTLDDFARDLDPVRARLPVVDQEIGDTWIHGTGTDPYKTARLRALMRLRRRWLGEGMQHQDVDAFRRFSDGLLMVAEHTWGLDVKTHLAEFETWEREAFHAARKLPAYRKLESSWAEQRAFLDDAVAALPTELRREARAEVREVLPDKFESRGHRQLEPRVDLRLARFIIGIDPATGAIGKLIRRSDRREWATKKSPLALLRYQTFDGKDYERFKANYLVNLDQHAGWAIPDFLKPNLERGRPLSALWLARLERSTWLEGPDADEIHLDLSFPDEARKHYGAPGRVGLRITAPKDDDRLDLDLRWFDKPACRLPEATWMTFAPAPAAVGDEGWTLDKLGQDVSPSAVIPGGNRRLHGIGTGAIWRGEGGSFALETTDAHLIAPGAPGLVDGGDKQPQSRHGMHVNLHNNTWGTNFPMWYDEDARFRFTLRFG